MAIYKDETTVQNVYTEESLRVFLWTETLRGKSLRELARTFNGITHADIQRGLKGQFPKKSRKRQSFGLIALELSEPCLKCGEVHTVPWCTKEAGIKRVTPAERKRRLIGG